MLSIHSPYDNIHRSFISSLLIRKAYLYTIRGHCGIVTSSVPIVHTHAKWCKVDISWSGEYRNNKQWVWGAGYRSSRGERCVYMRDAVDGVCMHKLLSSASQSLYSLSSKRSYRQTSWSVEAARFDATKRVSICNLTGISAAPLSMCLSNFRAIEKSKPDSRGLQTSRDVEVRRPPAYWIYTQGM